MLISLIAAMNKNRVIGKRNALPWYLPADLKHFKQLTVGKPVIMGSATFASIGKALPDRQNIILTHDADFQAEGCVTAHSVKEALQKASDAPEIMVIGGANVFAQFLSLAQRMYLTMIDAAIDGDVYFPEWSQVEWLETSRESHGLDEKNPYCYSFITLERIVKTT